MDTHSHRKITLFNDNDPNTKNNSSNTRPLYLKWGFSQLIVDDIIQQSTKSRQLYFSKIKDLFVVLKKTDCWCNLPLNQCPRLDLSETLLMADRPKDQYWDQLKIYLDNRELMIYTVLNNKSPGTKVNSLNRRWVSHLTLLCLYLQWRPWCSWLCLGQVQFVTKGGVQPICDHWQWLPVCSTDRMHSRKTVVNSKKAMKRTN